MFDRVLKTPLLTFFRFFNCQLFFKRQPNKMVKHTPTVRGFAFGLRNMIFSELEKLTKLGIYRSKNQSVSKVTCKTLLKNPINP